MTDGLHFAEPLWLWALFLPLLLWLLLPRMRHGEGDESRIAAYADPHLLPYLVLGRQDRRPSQRRRYLWWTLLWVLAILAMAGPRWDFTEIAVARPGTNLVILLDLSRSMDVVDDRPSRLGRARQEIEDLLDTNPGVKVGLIAFASVAHVVAPITEDSDTLRHLLPSLSTDLVRFPGSRLSQGFARAGRLLEGQPAGEPGALLVISDGDFVEEGLEAEASAMREAGIRVHVLGVGTPGGGPVPLMPMAGGPAPVMSRLEEEKLEQLASAGGGLYQRADFRESDTSAIWDRLLADAEPAAAEGDAARRVWNERYPWLVALAMMVLLVWFRRGAEPRRLADG